MEDGVFTTTEQSDTPKEEILLPVYGLPGYRFLLIHVTALVSLVTSILVSSSVLLYLNRPIKSFYSRPIGDRLVVYLALCDLLFSISHVMDHSVMVAIKDHPPDVACAAFGFLLNQFVVGQALIVIFTAFNAFSMIVLRKMIDTGRYDWKLQLYSMGIPAIVGVLGFSTNHFGPTGAWCYIDMRRRLGELLNNLVASIMIIAFVFNVGCYLGIWIRIRQVMQGQKTGHKYGRTAKVMMLFVAAYIGQWWAMITFITWKIFSEPHISITWAAVFFSNMGGVFNFFAYSFIKKKYQKVSDEQKSETRTK